MRSARVLAAFVATISLGCGGDADPGELEPGDSSAAERADALGFALPGGIGIDYRRNGGPPDVLSGPEIQATVGRRSVGGKLVPTLLGAEIRFRDETSQRGVRLVLTFDAPGVSGPARVRAPYWQIDEDKAAPWGGTMPALWCMSWMADVSATSSVQVTAVSFKRVAGTFTARIDCQPEVREFSGSFDVQPVITE